MNRLRRRIFQLAGAGLFVTWGAVSGCSATGAENEKERADIPEVVSVAHAGIRYEAVPWGRARGLSQNGGYVAAIDEKTGRERWIVKIYSGAQDVGMEADKLDIFIISMTLDPDGHHLRIVNERGDAYRLNIGSHEVTRLSQ